MTDFCFNPQHTAELEVSKTSNLAVLNVLAILSVGQCGTSKLQGCTLAFLPLLSRNFLRSSSSSDQLDVPDIHLDRKRFIIIINLFSISTLDAYSFYLFARQRVRTVKLEATKLRN